MERHIEQIGNNDLRFEDATAGGFNHIILSDADDGDTIVVNEDDISSLVNRLLEHIVKYNLLTKN